ncbi:MULTISPECIES: alpha/beta fold hydrolase [unclassified Rhizobacter]|uniref:alpha/beta hydrolase family protein n=1 Tax=unclassified Rhizobacter TaxID=2640088 RepID=UPI0006F59CC1|nr:MULTISPECIES: alpha/beta fold hydrolase [unclassified Rhizobacter]KQU79428.1 alpha/beta hydrolase [Rhizobacter sp. Root29]KQW05312.1 alpha/beta hydrolase [Rhizobacter sp. Root1238]KRB02246.1 alpha/beta hydrolase [Rhizobacter sp. Root16D2]
METLKLETDDGSRLSLRLYPPTGTAKAAVLIGGAMGVRQDYYQPFAQWLAGQGYAVATFDYRGMGESRVTRSLRGLKADLFSWARDYDSAIDALREASPGVPLYLVGHSLGAQLPGLLRNRAQVDGLISVAAGSGYWRDNAPPLRRMILYFWYVLVPVATALFGYFPGKRLRKVGDLPKGVMLQWRRWCLHPRYHVGAEGAAVREQFEAARFPLVALSITDDELMTERGTRVLVDCYPNAPRRIERIAPADVQAKRIGHFGLFREQFQATLWPRMTTLLNTMKETT